MIKINTSGDYVQLIYVDPVQESVQQELKSDTDAFECSYDSDGKLFMQFGAMRFENPDPTDFTINGSPITSAADFISKLNALFTGGGGSSFLPTSGTGTATGDVIGDLNGHKLNINQGATQGLSVSDEGYVGVGVNTSGYLWSVVNPTTLDVLEKIDIDGGETSLAFINALDASVNSKITFVAPGDTDGASCTIESSGNSTQVSLTAVTAGNKIIYRALNHIFTDVIALDFADDAAAAIGGVAVGALYHNSGAVRIRRS